MMLTRAAEDALLAVAFRGNNQVMAEPRAVRSALRTHGLLYHPPTNGTHATDTATRTGSLLAEYIRALRAAETQKPPSP